MSIARIKEAVSLPDLIGEYIRLRPSGAEHIALCPFHQEKTPSLRVHASFFKCFGCGLAGDCIDFLATIEGVSKGIALRMLSERTGIPLDASSTPLQRAHDREEYKFCLWWQARTIARMETQLTAYVMRADARAVEVGEVLARVRASKTAELRALVVRASTNKEWNEWRAAQEFDRWFAGVWMGIGEASCTT